MAWLDSQSIRYTWWWLLSFAAISPTLSLSRRSNGCKRWCRLFPERSDISSIRRTFEALVVGIVLVIVVVVVLILVAYIRSSTVDNITDQSISSLTTNDNQTTLLTYLKLSRYPWRLYGCTGL
jgi:quinol-cytochrome oxidoreductase complex cytochrome b subunit